MALAIVFQCTLRFDGRQGESAAIRSASGAKAKSLQQPRVGGVGGNG